MNSTPNSNPSPLPRENPYSAPEDIGEPMATDGCPTDNLSPADQRSLRVGRVVITWEKLRILYNLILGLEAALIFVLGIVWLDQFARPLAKTIIKGGIVANLCFCAGPIVDGYLSWLGLRNRTVTWLLFLLGTGLSVLIGLCFLASLTPFGMIDD